MVSKKQMYAPAKKTKKHCSYSRLGKTLCFEWFDLSLLVVNLLECIA